jgi:predicted histidine transporter YuiF (NhaC family)
MTEAELAERIRKIRDALNRRERRTIPESKTHQISKDQASGNSDTKAVNEAAALAVGDLENDAAKNEHGRTEKFRDHVALAILVVFWLAVIGICIAGLFWFWHLVVPDQLHFLNSMQVDRIGSILTGGAITTFISGYAKKRL